MTDSTTTHYDSSLSIMSKNGIAVVIGAAIRREWIDLDETVVRVELHADGRVVVDGTEITEREARVNWIESAVRYALDRGVKPEKVMAEVKIGKARARNMHVEMGKRGIPSGEHYRYASQVLGRPVFSLAALTEAEARLVWRDVVGRYPMPKGFVHVPAARVALSA